MCVLPLFLLRSYAWQITLAIPFFNAFFSIKRTLLLPLLAIRVLQKYFRVKVEVGVLGHKESNFIDFITLDLAIVSDRESINASGGNA